MKKENYLRRKSDINYNYSTIKVTKSRIEKGLLAIPASLVDKFPEGKKEINIYLDNSSKPLQKSFTPYKSSSRECRIGGMKDFFIKHNIKSEDEIVVEFFDTNKRKILPSKHHIVNELKIRLKNSPIANYYIAELQSILDCYDPALSPRDSLLIKI